MKAGFKTSEFWVTAGTLGATVAVTTGLLQPTDLEGVTSAWTQAVLSAATFATSVLYIWGRIKLKRGK